MHLRTVDFAETRKGDKNKTKKKKIRGTDINESVTLHHNTSRYITLYQKTNSRMVSWFCYL